MERSELQEGLRVWRTLLAGLERIVNDPEAIARMQRRALENPSILLGPTLNEYLGLDGSGEGEALAGEEWEGEEA